MYGYTFFYANVPGIVIGTVIYRGTITVKQELAVLYFTVCDWRFAVSAFGIL